MKRARTPVLLLLAGLLPAGATLANEPPYNTSTIPLHVNLVARGPAGPGTSVVGPAVVIVRDFAANPVAGARVYFDFSGCPDVAIAQDQAAPGVTVNCALRAVIEDTDANGEASIELIGTATAVTASVANCLRIYADGVLLGYPSVGVLDRDGADGLTLADLAYWTTDYFSSTHPDRANLDGVGGVDLGDLSVWAEAYFSGNNSLPTGPYCP